jgi:hypothetical protein
MDEGKLYPDYDHFSVYKDDITYELLKSYADRLPTEAAACRFAEGVDHGPPSPFISSRGAPDKKPLAPAAPPAAPAAPAAAPPVPAAAPETAPPPADPPTSRGVSRTAGVPS